MRESEEAGRELRRTYEVDPWLRCSDSRPTTRGAWTHFGGCVSARCPIRDGGLGDEGCAAGVHGDVAFAAVDLLAGVVPRERVGTVSAPRTDCELMIAAVGAGSRPS